MAIDATDWEITRSSGDVRYVGDDHGGASPTYATVIQFHRWLQDLADDASSAGDDELDITDENPSARSTDNIITLLGDYNITATEAEHLYDGSIIQGTVGVDREIWDGIVNFGNADVQIQILQDGAVLTDDWWNYNSAGLNPDPNQGISHRFMIKTHDFVADGGDIDGRRLIGTSRTFGNTFSEFSINGTSRGNNVLALNDASDLNNTTIEATVSGWSSITNTTEGFAELDPEQTGTTYDFYSEWNKDTYSINQFYERMKWLTMDGAASTIYGISGELFRGITHEVALTDLTTGNWNEPEALSWGTGATAGTGQLLAIDNVTSGSATKLWMQILTGVAPNANTITGATNSATATAGTVTDRSALISAPFCGASTGSAIIGSYGFGIEDADLSQNDKVFDLTNTQRTPPNNVTFTVDGLVDGEDRVLVAPWDGVSTDNEGFPAIDVDQMQLTAPLTSATQADAQVVSIPAGTPTSGTVRIHLVDGSYKRCAYSSITGGDTFVFTSSEDFNTSNSNASDNIYVSYIDAIAGAPAELSYTAVHTTDQSLVIIVRDGGTVNSTPIKQYIASNTFSSSDTTVTAIRTSDL